MTWFTVTAINAPGQRDDPGITGIMAGIGLAILASHSSCWCCGRCSPTRPAHDVEAVRMQAELNEVI